MADDLDAKIREWWNGSNVTVKNAILTWFRNTFTDTTKLSSAEAVAAGISVITPMIGELVRQDQSHNFLDKVWEWISSVVGKRGNQLTDYLVDRMVELKIVPPEIATMWKKTFSSLAGLSPLIVIATGALLIGEYIKTYMGVTNSLVQQKLASDLKPFLPPASEIINAAFIDPPTTALVRDVLVRSGIQEKHIDAIFKAQYAAYGQETIRDLYFRGEITEQKAYERMRELHYTDDRTAEILKTWNLLPGAQDVIRFAVREAFSPDQVQALGLDAEYPGTLTNWGKKIGLQQDVLSLFWRSHWQLPSASQGFEMLHRGVITELQLSALIKALDYSPVWRDKLEAISYNVVTRVDARRLYETGVWDEARLLKAYKEMGYSPTDAADLVNWTKKEYGLADKEASLSQVLDAQTAGIVSRTEAEGMIMALDYSKERADWLLDLNDYKAAARERALLIEGQHKLYVGGFQGETETRGELGRGGVAPELIGSLIRAWDVEKKVGQHLPSKTDYDKFAKAGIVTTAQYRDGLRALGYSEEIIYWYLALNLGVKAAADAQKAEDDKRAAEAKQKHYSKADWDNFLLSAIVSNADYIAGLKALGYDDAEAARYMMLVTDRLADIEAKKAAATAAAASTEEKAAATAAAKVLATAQKAALAAQKAFSKTDYDRFLKVGLITADEYLAGVQSLGYDEAEAHQYLQLVYASTEPVAREASRADYGKFLKAGLITEEQYQDGLLTLGYTQTDVNRYLALATGAGATNA